MNGRLFDPRLGRFMQGDPRIQDPGNLQNYNRYAYCYNNPTTCTDPTGQWNWNNVLNTNVGANLLFLDAGSFMLSRVTARNKTGYQLGSIAIGVLSAVWCEGAAYLCNAAGQAVWSGFAGRTFEESLKTGVIAGATTYAMGAVGDKWAGAGVKGWTTESVFLNTVGHTVVGCGSSVASGGSCQSGAMSGGFSSAWGNYGLGYESVNGDISILIKNTMIAATVGGVSSVVGGGKFWNGAQTGAFGYLFNDAVHPREYRVRMISHLDDKNDLIGHTFLMLEAPDQSDIGLGHWPIGTATFGGSGSFGLLNFRTGGIVVDEMTATSYGNAFNAWAMTGTDPKGGIFVQQVFVIPNVQYNALLNNYGMNAGTYWLGNECTQWAVSQLRNINISPKTNSYGLNTPRSQVELLGGIRK